MSTAAHGVEARVADLVVDCNDPGAVAAFWTALLGLTEVERSDGWIELSALGSGGPTLSFQQVPEAKQGKNRLHLDIVVPDALATARRALELGGSAASPLHEGDHGPWQVWRDPEGNEFCLVSGRS